MATALQILIKNKIVPFFTRNPWILPATSLVWGLVSGILISRDFQHTTRLVVFSFGLVLFSFLLSVWAIWQKRTATSKKPLSAIKRRLQRRAPTIEWLAVTATQIYVQYILMFCLPLLYFAKSWFVFCCTILFLFSSLWDPWWQKLVKKGWYRVSIRSWSLSLSFSFLYAIFFSNHLDKFYVTLNIVAMAGAFPYAWFARVKFLGRSNARVTDFIPAIIIELLAAGQYTNLYHYRFPLISVWLREPTFAIGELETKTFENLKSSNTMGVRELNDIFEGGKRLCCFTPVVAPGVVNASVTHEWTLDGVVLERIKLPKIRTTHFSNSSENLKTFAKTNNNAMDAASYRTFSCKKSIYFSDSKNATPNIGCKVFLDDVLYIGEVQAKFKKD